MAKRKIVFLTGTRADFGKLRSLIEVLSPVSFDTHLFVTGMHLNKKYGFTVEEILDRGFANVFQFINHQHVDHMDRTLAKTVDGFSHYIENVRPELIVVHGDRPEALAGAIVGSMNNIQVAHIEGGELSGTVDELVRHAVSKLSHTHFVANETAKNRLVQMGEKGDAIHVIGSPDLDIMVSDSLPALNEAKARYHINFDRYSIAMFHPVTTEVDNIAAQARSFVDALESSGLNYLVVYPNNDVGNEFILDEYKRISENSKFRIFPSLRFEYFLTFLKNCSFIIGNSSAGIREAPFYEVQTIDVGTRQNNRTTTDSVVRSGYSARDILEAIDFVKNRSLMITREDKHNFGVGNSDKEFEKILLDDNFWKFDSQKQFVDLQ